MMVITAILFMSVNIYKPLAVPASNHFTASSHFFSLPPRRCQQWGWSRRGELAAAAAAAAATAARRGFLGGVHRSLGSQQSSPHLPAASTVRLSALAGCERAAVLWATAAAR